MSSVNPILTITGSDSTGGSGVQADIKAISALGGYAVSAITSITVQNTLGIQRFYDIPAEIVSGQIEAIINDMQPQVVKIGMIRSVDVISVVTDALLKYKPTQVVYDPIVFSSRGDGLMSEDVLSQVRHRLIPLCSLVIVRKHDAEYILRREINNDSDMHAAEEAFKSLGCNAVLITDEARTHGFGNSLSSTVAVFLSRGETVAQAIADARSYISQQTGRFSDISGRGSELYNEFTDAVEEHCTTNSDVAFYADCLNVSSRYLAQVTRRIACKTPKNIIDEHLMNRIEVKLMTTDKTVQEIAYEFGFSSQAHFSKFFKKMKGVAPSSFRKSPLRLPQGGEFQQDEESFK